MTGPRAMGHSPYGGDAARGSGRKPEWPGDAEGGRRPTNAPVSLLITDSIGTLVKFSSDLDRLTADHEQHKARIEAEMTRIAAALGEQGQ